MQQSNRLAAEEVQKRINDAEPFVAIIEFNRLLSEAELQRQSVPGVLLATWIESGIADDNGFIRSSSEEPLGGLVDALTRFKAAHRVNFGELQVNTLKMEAFALEATAAEILGAGGPTPNCKDRIRTPPR